jgi:hypothetical protein
MTEQLLKMEKQQSKRGTTAVKREAIGGARATGKRQRNETEAQQPPVAAVQQQQPSPAQHDAAHPSQPPSRDRWARSKNRVAAATQVIPPDNDTGASSQPDHHGSQPTASPSPPPPVTVSGRPLYLALGIVGADHGRAVLCQAAAPRAAALRAESLRAVIHFTSQFQPLLSIELLSIEPQHYRR